MLGAGESGVVLHETGLEVPVSGGVSSYFNYYWLRDNCPSSFDPQTRERVYDIFAEDLPPRARTAAIAGGVLEVAWDGSNHVTRMPLDVLSRYAAGEKRADVARIARAPWYADHYPRMARFSQPDLAANRSCVRDWAAALLTDGVALLTHMPATEVRRLAPARLIGHVPPSYVVQVCEA